MSAIAGLFHVDGRPARSEDAAPLVDAQAHRGPDGTSVAVNGPVALGHCLLHTTAESRRERQPQEDAEAGLLLTADVRLDDRDELIERLDAPPYATDPDLILAAYRRWGTSCVKHLTGDFAFCLWDEKARHLFCATDHLGVKPLHYAWRNGSRFICATEEAAILRGGDVPNEIDDLHVAEFLLAPVEDDHARTFHRSIHVLPPAHTVLVSADGMRIEKYWSLDPDRELRLSSDAEYAQAFREQFERAVARRLRTDRPVGSMLSGGLDSSAVSSMAAYLLAERGDGPLRTYSAVFDTATEADERAYIRKVVERYPVVPYYFVADDAGPYGRIETFVETLPGPLTAGNLFINRILYGQAGTDGCRMVLSGFDGDTTISHGLDYLRELRDAGRYLSLIREVRAASRLRDEPWIPAARSWMKGPVHRLLGIGTLRRVLRVGSTPAAHQTPERTPERWEKLLSPELAAVVREARPEPRPFHSERYEHHHRLTRPLLSRTSRLLDLCAGAAGVETRYPFLDRRLIEFCLSVPPNQKLKDGWTRSILRRGTEGVLPEEIRWRASKANLQPGFSHSFRTYDGEAVTTTLAPPPDSLRHYVNPAFVADLLSRFDDGSLASTEENILFRVFSLTRWLQKRQS